MRAIRAVFPGSYDRGASLGPPPASFTSGLTSGQNLLKGALGAFEAAVRSTSGPDDSFPLSAAAAGQRVRIYRVGDEEGAKLAYLEEHGLMPGRLLEVKEVRTVDGVVTVEDEEGETRILGGPLAGSVFVRSVSQG